MTLLSIEALHVKLQSVDVLQGVNLLLRPGEMVGLLGRNGAGKTTTLRAVMGLVGSSAGRISLCRSGSAGSSDASPRRARNR